MGVAAPQAGQAPVGSWGPGPPQNFGSSLLVNCYLENKFHNKIRLLTALFNKKLLVIFYSTLYIFIFLKDGPRILLPHKKFEV